MPKQSIAPRTSVQRFGSSIYSRTNRSVNVRCYLNGSGAGKLTAELRDGNRVISTQSVNVSSAADDLELVGDGIDATRVVMRVTDEYGAVRPLANAAIKLNLEGPGEIVAENPFSLFGGVGAVWIKTREAAGVIRLTATHPTLGSKTIQIRVKEAQSEIV